MTDDGARLIPCMHLVCPEDCPGWEMLDAAIDAVAGELESRELATCRRCGQTFAAPPLHDPLKGHADYCEPGGTDPDDGHPYRGDGTQDCLACTYPLNAHASAYGPDVPGRRPGARLFALHVGPLHVAIAWNADSADEDTLDVSADEVARAAIEALKLSTLKEVALSN